MHLIENFEFPQEFNISTNEIKINFNPYQWSRLF